MDNFHQTVWLHIFLCVFHSLWWYHAPGQPKTSTYETMLFSCFIMHIVKQLAFSVWFFLLLYWMLCTGMSIHVMHLMSVKNLNLVEQTYLLFYTDKHFAFIHSVKVQVYLLELRCTFLTATRRLMCSPFRFCPLTRTSSSV